MNSLVPEENNLVAAVRSQPPFPPLLAPLMVHLRLREVGSHHSNNFSRLSFKLESSFFISRLLVLGICFTLFLFGNGEKEGLIWSLHGISNEDDGGGDKVSNFISMTAWRIRFPNSDIKAG